MSNEMNRKKYLDDIERIAKRQREEILKNARDTWKNVYGDDEEQVIDHARIKPRIEQYKAGL